MALADGFQEFCSLTCQEVPEKRFELQTCSFCFAVRPPVKGVGCELAGSTSWVLHPTDSCAFLYTVAMFSTHPDPAQEDAHA